MNKLTVTSLESSFRVYDLRTQHPKEGFAYVSENVSKGASALSESILIKIFAGAR